ncbi:MAG: hypothetical protein H0T51_24370, partial [Pirellulales bacterium]|nr:hypothetical protein [Pirellulales bacterium]
MRKKMLAELATKVSDELNAEILLTDDDSRNHRSKQEISKTEAELATQLKQVAAHQEQLFQMASQFEQQERSRRDTPIEGAVAQIFPLRHAKAAEAAGTLESLFGSQVRVAVDERSNNLVVSGKEKSLEAVRSLLQGLDEPAVAGNEGGAVAASTARTVLLRVFWLADGLPGDEGQDPVKFLPPAVIHATTRLGLNDPRLVTQTVNSLAIGDQPEVEFSTHVPAMLFSQPTDLQCAGSMRPMDGDRTALNMDIHVQGPSIVCKLKGSLATPLGHYMVLGTANSVIAEPMAMAGGAMMGDGGMYSSGRGDEGGYGGADPAAAVPGAEG